MDKQTMVHLYRMLLSNKNEYISDIWNTWKKSQILFIILSERSQTQKVTYCMIFTSNVQNRQIQNSKK